MKNLNHSRALAARLFVAGTLLAVAVGALADVRYVDVNGTNPTRPYATWATAATNIQDAVDAAVAGDEIVVTNGTYVTGLWTNAVGRSRVVVDKPVSLRSVNGPQSTFIDGGGTNRCVCLSSGATLSGFTLTYGGSGTGGGAYGGTLSNCTLSGNSAQLGGGVAQSTLINCTLIDNSADLGSDYHLGGGAYSCTLNNCRLIGNRATGSFLPTPYNDFGGGAYDCTLSNCTLTGNSAFYGGGASFSTLNNCIAYFNTARAAANYDPPTTLNYSCTTPLPSTGLGNIAAAPEFVDYGSGDLHLQPNSPCINAGQNAFAPAGPDLDGNPRIVRGTVDMGAYEFQAVTHYVDVKSTDATPPYTNWATAATNMQDAVDAAVAGDEIVVTNGVYSAGGRAIDGITTNRVTVDKPLNVRSLNGPQFTAIDGGGSVRCLYLADSASVSGFTLTNGNAGDPFHVFTGGGGGVYGGTLNNCTLSGNSAEYNGGASHSTLNNCLLVGNTALDGGGAGSSTLNNCTLSSNSAASFSCCVSGNGGGANGCLLNNCTLNGNVAAGQRVAGTSYSGGGGAYGSTLNNCTLTGNRADGFHAIGGGALDCTLNNCILFNNTDRGGCADCGSPGSLVGSNWFGDPLFVDWAGGNLRLQSNSPCINAGLNALAPAGPDLDGNPRIVGGTVDIGAYEFQLPTSTISYAWLQQYNLPINPATDTADPDGDGVDNYHEWLAGTDPTNRFSAPAQLTILPSGTNVILSWPTNAVGFTLQSTTNLLSPALWTTNSAAPVVLGGQNVVTNLLAGPQQFYRLVQ